MLTFFQTKYCGSKKHNWGRKSFFMRIPVKQQLRRSSWKETSEWKHIKVCDTCMTRILFQLKWSPPWARPFDLHLRIWGVPGDVKKLVMLFNIRREWSLSWTWSGLQTCACSWGLSCSREALWLKKTTQITRKSFITGSPVRHRLWRSSQKETSEWKTIYVHESCLSSDDRVFGPGH